MSLNLVFLIVEQSLDESVKPFFQIICNRLRNVRPLPPARQVSEQWLGAAFDEIHRIARLPATRKELEWECLRGDSFGARDRKDPSWNPPLGPEGDPLIGSNKPYVVAFLKGWDASCPSRGFASRIQELVNLRFDGNPVRLYREAGMSRQAYSRIISYPADYHPSKETVLHMARAFQLDLQAAAEFLALAGFALSPAIAEDRVWSVCFRLGIFDRIQVADLLSRFAGR